jgi:hypothetical protein
MLSILHLNDFFCKIQNSDSYYMSFFMKDEDLDKPIRTFSYLKKGEGKGAQQKKGKPKFPFLKKGEGKLVSNYHGKTNFAEKRKEDIEKNQLKREHDYWIEKK